MLYLPFGFISLFAAAPATSAQVFTAVVEPHSSCFPPPFSSTTPLGGCPSQDTLSCVGFWLSTKPTVDDKTWPLRLRIGSFGVESQFVEYATSYECAYIKINTIYIYIYIIYISYCSALTKHKMIYGFIAIRSILNIFPNKLFYLNEVLFDLLWSKLEFIKLWCIFKWHK